MTAISRRTVLGAAVAAAVPARSALATPQRGYLGSYTYRPGEGPADLGPHLASQGIYAFDFDARDGTIVGPWLAAQQSSPTNLILHPNRRIVYACQGGDFGPQGEASITALAIQGRGLHPFDRTGSGGTGPTHGTIDRRGRFLVTTNFSSDEVVAFRLGPDGALLDRTARLPTSLAPQSAPPPPGTPIPPLPAVCHSVQRDLTSGCRTKPHIAVFSPAESWVLVAEIATDSIAVYRFDAATGALTLHALAAALKGSGPRHLAWAPDGRFVYSSDEHGSSVTAWRWDEATGTATRQQTLSTVPVGYAGRNTTAHISVHPGGTALWVSNRGHPSLAGFRIDPRSGSLTPTGHANTGSRDCWCFDFDRSGRWLLAALMSTDTLAVFRVDPAHATLERSPQRISAPFPTCLRMA